MNLYLLIHNIGFLISAFATLTALFFLLLNNPRAKGHIPLALTCLAVTVFIISHILGVTATDPEISRNILMWNLSNLFIGMFNVHAFLAILGKDKEKKNFLVLLYIIGIALTFWFIKNPELFLLPSEPKMYFPNYYVPGEYHWLRLVYLFAICVPYMFYVLVEAYRESENIYNKKQIKYLISGFIVAYGVGFIPNFLVYNIPLDPLYGMAFMFFFAIFFLYGAIKYELMNIKVIAKQASVYALIVGSIGASTVVLEYLNNYLIASYPGFPIWVVPAISIILVMLITLVVWKKIRQVDLLKYEFITTVTHKFRTPLTQIKWSVDNLLKKNFTEEEKQEILYIQSAAVNLVELTNLLVAISDSDGVTYNYHPQKVDLKSLIEETVDSHVDFAKKKKITIVNNIKKSVNVEADESRLKFVIQTFIENAIHYNHENSIVEINQSIKNDKVTISVKDNGIGIPEKELPLIFTKFYRGDKARLIDTEGMGIGLFVTREIILRHHGKVGVESLGLNKGSTFSFILPIA